jgi:hypothetical protein
VYNWIISRIVPITGVTALLFGIIIAVIGLEAYGVSVGTNLLAGASDLLISIAVATFIIERIDRVNTRRQWLTAYRALHGLLAAAFVDVMRLLSVYSSIEAYEGNMNRYTEFVGIATLHVEDLRSTAQGFASVLDPAVHTLCRTIERRLSWMVHTLAVDRGGPGLRPHELIFMAATGKFLAEFIAKEDNHRYSTAVHSAEVALRDCGFTPSRLAGSDLGEMMRYRMSAQSRMIENNSHLLPRVSGIYYDVDNELAIYYFALDQMLLTVINSAIASGNDAYQRKADPM